MTKANEMRVLRELVDELGADFMVQFTRRPELEPIARLRQRNKVVKEALAHHASLAGTTRACRTTTDDPPAVKGRKMSAGGTREHVPVAPTFSPAHMSRAGRVAVIGPAPVASDTRLGEAGHSRAERTLARFLRSAGLADDDISWLHACWCWPTDDRDSTRSLTAEDVAFWSEWTEAALIAADVDWVLLHGLQAVKLWRSDLAIGQLSGGLYLWKSRWKVAVIPHASAVMRPDGVPETDWKRDIAQFVGQVTEDAGLEQLGLTCVKCGAAVRGYDPDGVPWCGEHLEAGVKGKERADKRAAQARTSRQGVLL